MLKTRGNSIIFGGCWMGFGKFGLETCFKTSNLKIHPFTRSLEDLPSCFSLKWGDGKKSNIYLHFHPSQTYFQICSRKWLQELLLLPKVSRYMSLATTPIKNLWLIVIAQKWISLSFYSIASLAFTPAAGPLKGRKVLSGSLLWYKNNWKQHNTTQCNMCNAA